MGRVRTKFRNVSILVAAAETPVPLALDRLRLQWHAYTARLTNGLAGLGVEVCMTSPLTAFRRTRAHPKA